MGRSVRRVAFALRPSRNETELSFYDSDRMETDEVLANAPGAGWGVVGVRAGSLRALGFSLRRDSRDAHPGVVDRAHVLARPAATLDGQIPPEVRLAVALAAHWVIEPSP